MRKLRRNGSLWENVRTIYVTYIYTHIWVCLKMGYTPNYGHLVGIMISKTIGCRGTLFSDTPIWLEMWDIYGTCMGPAWTIYGKNRG